MYPDSDEKCSKWTKVYNPAYDKDSKYKKSGELIKIVLK